MSIVRIMPYTHLFTTRKASPIFGFQTKNSFISRMARLFVPNDNAGMLEQDRPDVVAAVSTVNGSQPSTSNAQKILSERNHPNLVEDYVSSPNGFIR